MSTFAKINNSKLLSLALYQTLLTSAILSAPLELASTIKLQKLYRGYAARSKLHHKRCAAIVIERVHRGTASRILTKEIKTEKLRLEDMAVFNYHVMCITKVYRGWYSRKHLNDFHARKAYIMSVVTQGDKLRESLNAKLEQQRIDDDIRDEEVRQKEFKHVIQKLHHLVSTKSISGIYNSPYTQGNPQTSMGVTIENHLIHGVKDLLRTKRYTSQTVNVLERDMNGTLKIPLKQPYKKISIQAESLYDIVDSTNKSVEKANKNRWTSKKTFASGGKTKDASYITGISNNTQFVDAYKNPLNTRGEIPIPGADRVEYKTFYTSVGGNKSVVEANGLFDVIGDCEVRGGVTNRTIKFRRSMDMDDLPETT